MPLTELQSFNRMIDRRMAASPVDGLIVYPEGMMACAQKCLLLMCDPPRHSMHHLHCCVAGHRSTRRTSLPMKRGMLAYAFSRKVPVQVGHHAGVMHSHV